MPDTLQLLASNISGGRHPRFRGSVTSTPVIRDASETGMGTAYDVVTITGEYVFRGVCIEVETRQAKFERLRDAWKEATDHLSSVHMFIDDSYQQILGMGVAAVPLILRDLRDNGGQWSWALRSITGENPAAGVLAGDLRAQGRAWVEWGVQRGLVEA